MGIQFIGTGGRLVIFSASGGTTLNDGLCAQNTSYRVTVSKQTAQCQESAEEEVFTSLVSHELSGTYNYQTNDTTMLFGIGSDNAWANYYTQNGTTLFSGTVQATAVDDSQGGRGTVETMSVTLRNNGSPTVGFGV